MKISRIVGCFRAAKENILILTAAEAVEFSKLKAFMVWDFAGQGTLRSAGWPGPAFFWAWAVGSAAGLWDYHVQPTKLII